MGGLGESRDSDRSGGEGRVAGRRVGLGRRDRKQVATGVAACSRQGLCRGKGRALCSLKQKLEQVVGKVTLFWAGVRQLAGFCEAIGVESKIWGISGGGRQGLGGGASRAMGGCQAGEGGPAAGWGQQAGVLSAGGGSGAAGMDLGSWYRCWLEGRAGTASGAAGGGLGWGREEGALYGHV